MAAPCEVVGVLIKGASQPIIGDEAELARVVLLGARDELGPNCLHGLQARAVDWRTCRQCARLRDLNAREQPGFEVGRRTPTQTPEMSSTLASRSSVGGFAVHSSPSSCKAANPRFRLRFLSRLT